MKVAVIGSGLSGLTAGALLAQAGHQVKVYEQHEKIGGVTATIEQDGFKWDQGQMIIPDLGTGEPGRKILEKLGISDRVQVIPGWRGNVFPDFEIWRPEKYLGRHWRKYYLKNLFPEDAQGIENYYKLYEDVLDLVGLYNEGTFPARARMLLKMLKIIRIKNVSAKKLLDRYFTNPKLQMAYIEILADYTLRPEDFPGLAIPLINAEQEYDDRIPLDYENRPHRSSWNFIRGGLVELVNALAGALKRYGGEILTGTATRRILVSDNSVAGIMLEDGHREHFDAVIASGGAKELFQNMVGRQHLSDAFLQKHVDNLYTTGSVFMVHLGVDYDPSVYQHNSALCYYYLTYDLEKALQEGEQNIYHEGKYGFLIYIPSIHSPDMAPKGYHDVTVYTIAPNHPANGSWAEDRERWADRLLEIAEGYVPGLRQHTLTRLIITPEEFRRRSYLYQHAFGGCPPALGRTPPPHKTPINGLMFVGAQSEAYGGVTGAMIGTEKAVKKLLGRRWN